MPHSATLPATAAWNPNKVGKSARQTAVPFRGQTTSKFDGFVPPKKRDGGSPQRGLSLHTVSTAVPFGGENYLEVDRFTPDTGLLS